VQPRYPVDAACGDADVPAARNLRGRSGRSNQTKAAFPASDPKVVCGYSFQSGCVRSAFGTVARAWMRLVALSAACAFATQACTPGLRAQSGPHTPADVPETSPFTAQMLSSYDGQKVASVQLAGQPDLQEDEFASSLQQRAGEPFSASKVRETADALKSKGKFEAVRIQVRPEADGINVVFVLEPAMYFGVFEFPGAGRFSYPRLLQVTNYPIQAAFNKTEVEEDTSALVKFFQQQGFFHATVHPETKVDAAHGIANIAFNTTLGIQAKFDSTNIEGLPPQETKTYEHKLRSIWWRLLGAAIRPEKPYRYAAMMKAQKHIQSSLESKGLLSAQVALSGAEYNPTSNQASVHFKVTPGPRVHVRIEGAHLWSWTRKKLLPFYQGIGVDQESVDQGRESLISHFQDQGYFDAAVASQLSQNGNNETVEYRVVKGKKRKVSEVSLSGNRHISTSRLMQGIEVKEAHLFSRGKYSQALMYTSQSNLAKIYQSEGYGGVQVRSRVVNHGKKLHAYFAVTEGPRDIVNSLTIEGNQTFPESKFAPGGLQVRAGEPYSQVRLEADRQEIVRNYLEAGYLTSTFRETASEVSKKEPHRINVVYQIYEGPRVETGDIFAIGRVRTQERLIDEDLRPMRPGQPYRESDLLRAGTELYDETGVFDWAEVDPRRPVTTQTREDVVAKVHEAKRNEFTYGVGFEVINRGGNLPSGTVALPSLPPVGLPSKFTTSQKTFYGPRGTAQYTRNNIFGKGDSLSLTAFAGRLDQRGAIYLINPKIFWEAWRATTTFSVEKDEENPIFSFEQGVGTFQLQKPIDRSKKDILFLRYSFNKTSIAHVLIPDLVPAKDLNVRLSTLAANLTRDTRDNPLDEHNGVLRSLEIDFNSSKLGSSVDFAKLTGQAAIYREKFDHIVWADSIRIGLEQPFNNSFVPLSEEFFTGGGNSLRGIPLDGAGPQRSIQVCTDGTTTCASPTLIPVPNGGNELLILNSEARIPLPFKDGLSIVPFYDGGNVFSNVGFHNFVSLYSNNVGLGLRYSTPVGPIRVDVGRDLNAIPGVTPTKHFRTQFFVTIGQAF
jgi:outer membrane protein insertion porin family